MTDRHTKTLLQFEEESNPPDLLRQIVEDIKKLVPESGEAARNWLRGKSKQELAKVQEIQARVYEKIGQLEIERQREIRQREEAHRRAELEWQREQHNHERSLRELEIQQFRERTRALREIVDCLVKLRQLGIEFDLKVIKSTEVTAMSLLEDNSA